MTIWAPLDTQPIGVIEAIDRQFSQPLKDLILGVERDTRVRNQAKINILTKDNIGFDLFYKNGITIGQRRCYPKPLRPRPPPSKRGYLPNFPILESGILYERVSARTYKDTGIKLGGWTAHAHMDSVTPESVVFDDQVYAILWKGRSKKPTAKPDETTEPAKPNETTEPAKPDETTQPAKPDETTQPAKSDETTTRPEENDVEMQLVLSKNQRKKLKKKTASSNNHGNRIDKKTKI